MVGHVPLAWVLSAVHYSQLVDRVLLAHALTAIHCSQWVDYVPIALASIDIHYSQWVDHVPRALGLTAVHYSQWFDRVPLRLTESLGQERHLALRLSEMARRNSLTPFCMVGRELLNALLCWSKACDR